VTAAGNLGTSAAHVLPSPYAAGAAVFALLYGVPVWGFAMMWLALAIAITVRTARRGLPFALTWWAFTFPLGHLCDRLFLPAPRQAARSPAVRISSA
jgi:tellurite resistance protein TehA-like permease